MRLRTLIISILLLLLAIGYFPYVAFADVTDKATLGGQDSSGKYHWRVNTNGHFIPGTTAQNDIGGTSNRVSTLYTGAVNATGDLTFKTNLISVGRNSGGVTSVVTGIESLTPSFDLARVIVSTKTLTIGNGTAGQVFTLLGYEQTGTLTITATTKKGWSSAEMNANGDTITLLYLDDTNGWVVIGTNSVTVTGLAA